MKNDNNNLQFIAVRGTGKQEINLLPYLPVNNQIAATKAFCSTIMYFVAGIYSFVE